MFTSQKHNTKDFGSFPITKLAKSKRINVYVDTDRGNSKVALKVRSTGIKPNIYELLHVAGEELLMCVNLKNLTQQS